MAEFALHVLKLNIISAVVIFSCAGVICFVKEQIYSKMEVRGLAGCCSESAGSCATSIGFFPYKFQSAGD